MSGHELFQAILAGTRAFAAACYEAGEGGTSPQRTPAVLDAGITVDGLLVEARARLLALDRAAKWSQDTRREDARARLLGDHPYTDPLPFEVDTPVTTRRNDPT